MTPTLNPPALLPDDLFLMDLAGRLFRHATPAMGFDQGDTDRLYRIARGLSTSAEPKAGEDRAGATKAAREMVDLRRRARAYLYEGGEGNCLAFLKALVPPALSDREKLEAIFDFCDEEPTAEASAPAEPKGAREAVEEAERYAGKQDWNGAYHLMRVAYQGALSNPPADGLALRAAAINAALCLSGFAGEGIEIEGFQAPEDAYGGITAALGIPDADDDDLRNALRALLKSSAPLGALEGGR